MPLLEVEGLVKYFGRRRVVDGVSFGVNTGEVVGLLGPNGAGKTTSFRMATGQITPNGEKGRLEIARCLVCEPLLILLDEPFAAVDPKTTEDIRSNIRDLANHGIGILITDHNVREVFRSADRVYLISEGKVVTHGTPHELVNDQKAIDAYLGRSFEEDGFTRHFAARRESQAGSSTAVPTLPPKEPPPAQSRPAEPAAKKPGPPAPPPPPPKPAPPSPPPSSLTMTPPP